MRFAMLLSFCVLASVSTSYATGACPGLQDPGLCTLPNPIVVAPNGFLNRVTLICASEPLADAVVEIRFTDYADDVLAWCEGQAHPSLVDTTDASGIVEFTIFGGGCTNEPTSSDDISVEIYVDGRLAAEAGVISVDVVDSNGDMALEGWDPNGASQVSLSDSGWFTPYFSGGTYHFCADLDRTYSVGLSDAIIFSPYISNSVSCSVP